MKRHSETSSKTGRIACPWLIRTFIDPNAEVLFVLPDELSYDAPDARYTPSRGLLAMAEGFSLLDLGDHRQLELSLPVYDALYARCRRELREGRG